MWELRLQAVRLGLGVEAADKRAATFLMLISVHIKQPCKCQRGDLRFPQLDQSQFCRTVERLFREQMKQADPSGGGEGGASLQSCQSARPRFRLTRATYTGQMVEVHIKSMLGVK